MGCDYLVHIKQQKLKMLCIFLKALFQWMNLTKAFLLDIFLRILDLWNSPKSFYSTSMFVITVILFVWILLCKIDFVFINFSWAFTTVNSEMIAMFLLLHNMQLDSNHNNYNLNFEFICIEFYGNISWIQLTLLIYLLLLLLLISHDLSRTDQESQY